jgi:TonB family protein
MRSAIVLLTLMALMGARQDADSQSLSDGDLAAIRTSLVDKTLVLKSYAFDPVVSYEYTDGHLMPGPIHRKGLAIFTLQDLQQRHGFLEISGTQKLYVRTEGGQSLSPTHGDPHLTIAIYLASVPNETTFVDHLKSDLFYDSLQEAFAAVPVYLQPCVPQVYSPAKQALLAGPACNAAKDPAAPNPPQLTKSVDPSLPPSVRLEKPGEGQWQVIVSCTLNEHGVPEDVHVTKPALLTPGAKLSEMAAKDLDDTAISAVKQFRFRPATRDGKPVPFHINIAMNFQSFGH